MAAITRWWLYSQRGGGGGDCGGVMDDGGAVGVGSRQPTGGGATRLHRQRAVGARMTCSRCQQAMTTYIDCEGGTGEDGARCKGHMCKHTYCTGLNALNLQHKMLAEIGGEPPRVCECGIIHTARRAPPRRLAGIHRLRPPPPYVQRHGDARRQPQQHDPPVPPGAGNHCGGTQGGRARTGCPDGEQLGRKGDLGDPGWGEGICPIG